MHVVRGDWRARATIGLMAVTIATAGVDWRIRMMTVELAKAAV